MFEGDSADTFPLMSTRGRAEGPACTDPGVRTPIAVEGNWGGFLSQPNSTSTQVGSDKVVSWTTKIKMKTTSEKMKKT